MNATPRASSVCDLPTFRTWCRQLTPSQQAVQASPAPTTTTATVASDGTGLKEGRSISITLANPTTPANAGTYLRGLVTNTDGALVWDAALPEAPKTGDLVVDADFDADAVVIIDGVSSWLEQITRTVFRTRTITQTFGGDNRPKKPLLYRPVVSVTSVQVDDGTVLTDSSLWFLEADRGLITLKNGQVFASGIGNCQVIFETGVDGYVSAESGRRWDDAYLAAAADLMKVIFDRVQNGTLTIASMNAGPFGTSIKAGLPDTLQMQIDALRDVRGMF